MDHVLDLINKQKLSFNASGRDYLVKCLNPEHEDSSPSMRIDKVTGKFHCFACAFKGDLFKHYGVVGNFTSIKTAKLKEKLKALNINFNGVEFPGEMIPMTRTFRGISSRTLKEFGAFYTTSDEKLQDRLFFPIKDIRGKPVVFVGRLMLSQGTPRYLNVPGGITMPLYPESFPDKYTSVVLVEGLFDMLNLYDKGLKNVSCTFGTNTLQNNLDMKMLPLKVQGIQKVYLMFDGDEAGREAMKKLQPLLEEAGYEVEIIPVEDDNDPGNYSQEEVDSVREWINR